MTIFLMNFLARFFKGSSAPFNASFPSAVQAKEATAQALQTRFEAWLADNAEDIHNKILDTCDKGESFINYYVPKDCYHKFNTYFTQLGYTVFLINTMVDKSFICLSWR